MNDSLANFCDNIRQLRKKQRLTIKEMAERLNVSTRSISMLEKGVIPPRLSLDIVFLIQGQFGIPICYIFKPHIFSK